MKSIEARRAYYSPEEESSEKVVEFSLEADTGPSEREILGNKRTIAEMFIRNPAFKSEKAQRALRKLKEAWRAADEDLPEELKNELRHERRDTSALQDPVHISSILADAPTRQPGLASMRASDDTAAGILDEDVDFYPEDDDMQDVTPGGRANSIYRQAIISGFATALALVIAFMLFLLLSR